MVLCFCCVCRVVWFDLCGLICVVDCSSFGCVWSQFMARFLCVALVGIVFCQFLGYDRLCGLFACMLSSLLSCVVVLFGFRGLVVCMPRFVVVWFDLFG